MTRIGPSGNTALLASWPLRSTALYAACFCMADQASPFWPVWVLPVLSQQAGQLNQQDWIVLVHLYQGTARMGGNLNAQMEACMRTHLPQLWAVDHGPHNWQGVLIPLRGHLLPLLPAWVLPETLSRCISSHQLPVESHGRYLYACLCSSRAASIVMSCATYPPSGRGTCVPLPSHAHAARDALQRRMRRCVK